eukprot:8721951-Lingulodinium_polyedra.AAC.1
MVPFSGFAATRDPNSPPTPRSMQEPLALASPDHRSPTYRSETHARIDVELKFANAPRGPRALLPSTML